MPDDLDPPIDVLMEQLIVQARAIAWKHWHGAPYVLDFDELVSLAYEGLMSAAARWETYCQERGFDPATTRFYSVYCRRRMEGAILDYKRSKDWASRTDRNNARSLRDAGQDLGLSEAQLAEATGLSRAEVAQTLAAVARRPVQFDPVEHDMRDANADSESRAVTGLLLDAAVSALEAQPLAVQLSVILTFYIRLSVKDAAALMGLQTAEVTELQRRGALVMHEALVKASGKD